MIFLAQPLYEWLKKYYSEKLPLIECGKVELITAEMKKAYNLWLKTEEGKQYKIGGIKRDPNWFNKRGTK